jgi:hypothetical protein
VVQLQWVLLQVNVNYDVDLGFLYISATIESFVHLWLANIQKHFTSRRCRCVWVAEVTFLPNMKLINNKLSIPRFGTIHKP